MRSKNPSMTPPRPRNQKKGSIRLAGKPLPSAGAELEARVLQSLRECSNSGSITQAREAIDNLFDEHHDNLYDVLCIFLREVTINCIAHSVPFVDNENDSVYEDEEDEEEVGAHLPFVQIQKPSRLGTVPFPSAHELGLGSLKDGDDKELDDDEEDEKEMDSETLQLHMNEWRRKLSGAKNGEREVTTHLDFFQSLLTGDEEDGFIGISDLPDDFGVSHFQIGECVVSDDDASTYDDDDDHDDDHDDDGGDDDDLDAFYSQLLQGKYVQENPKKEATTIRRRPQSIGGDLLSQFDFGGYDENGILPCSHPPLGPYSDGLFTRNKRLGREIQSAILKTMQQYSRDDSGKNQPKKPLPAPRKRLDRCGMPALSAWGKGPRFASPNKSPSSLSSKSPSPRQSKPIARPLHRFSEGFDCLIPEPVLSSSSRTRKPSRESGVAGLSAEAILMSLSRRASIQPVRLRGKKKC